MAQAPQVPRRTFTDLARVAEELQASHHPAGELPIPIEEIIEFDCAIDIVPIPGLMSDLDIDAFMTADLKEIRVDQYIQQKALTRYRASLAHEVSHSLIHRQSFEQRRFVTVRE